jgi:hypothetical protein
MLYVLATVATCVTGFFIFHHGGFGKAHALGIITLFVLLLAWIAERRSPFGQLSRYATDPHRLLPVPGLETEHLHSPDMWFKGRLNGKAGSVSTSSSTPPKSYRILQDTDAPPRTIIWGSLSRDGKPTHLPNKGSPAKTTPVY